MLHVAVLSMSNSRPRSTNTSGRCHELDRGLFLTSQVLFSGSLYILSATNRRLSYLLTHIPQRLRLLFSITAPFAKGPLLIISKIITTLSHFKESCVDTVSLRRKREGAPRARVLLAQLAWRVIPHHVTCSSVLLYVCPSLLPSLSTPPRLNTPLFASLTYLQLVRASSTAPQRSASSNLRACFVFDASALGAFVRFSRDSGQARFARHLSQAVRHGRRAAKDRPGRLGYAGCPRCHRYYHQWHR